MAFNYPKEFLDVRGHDIENAFVGKELRKKIVEDIVTRVYQNGLTYIPLDLAEVFFSLNQKVRTNIRVVIKPGIPEPDNKLGILSTAAAGSVSGSTLLQAGAADNKTSSNDTQSVTSAVASTAITQSLPQGPQETSLPFIASLPVDEPDEVIFHLEENPVTTSTKLSAPPSSVRFSYSGVSSVRTLSATSINSKFSQHTATDNQKDKGSQLGGMASNEAGQQITRDETDNVTATTASSDDKGLEIGKSENKTADDKLKNGEGEKQVYQCCSNNSCTIL